MKQSFPRLELYYSLQRRNNVNFQKTLLIYPPLSRPKSKSLAILPLQFLLKNLTKLKKQRNLRFPRSTINFACRIYKQISFLIRRQSYPTYLIKKLEAMSRYSSQTLTTHKPKITNIRRHLYKKNKEKTHYRMMYLYINLLKSISFTKNRHSATSAVNLASHM